MSEVNKTSRFPANDTFIATRVTPELQRDFVEFARREERTVSQQLRFLITEYVERCRSEDVERHREERARAIEAA